MKKKRMHLHTDKHAVSHQRIRLRSGELEEYKRRYEAELEKWKLELERTEKDAAKTKVDADRLLKENQHVR